MVNGDQLSQDMKRVELLLEEIHYVLIVQATGQRYRSNIQCMSWLLT